MSLPLAVVISGNTPDVGTVGTIISGIVALSGTITVGSIIPVSNFTGTASATVKGSAGNLWGFAAENQSPSTAGGTATGTLILLNYQAGLANAIATIIAEMEIPAKDYRFRDYSRPLSFGTLVASVLGTLVYHVSYE